jgi:hypothetical protein
MRPRAATKLEYRNPKLEIHPPEADKNSKHLLPVLWLDREHNEVILDNGANNVPLETETTSRIIMDMSSPEGGCAMRKSILSGVLAILVTLGGSGFQHSDAAPFTGYSVELDVRNAGQLFSTPFKDSGSSPEYTKRIENKAVVDPNGGPLIPIAAAEVSSSLRFGTLKATTLSTYFLSSFLPAWNDSYTTASAQVTMGDVIRFGADATPGIGFLDVLLTGSFVREPNTRLIGWASAVNSASVSGNVFAPTWTLIGQTGGSFVPDEDSKKRYPNQPEIVVGETVLSLASIPFEVTPDGTLQVVLGLSVFGNTGWDTNFGTTAKAALRLPEGVTYTSGSGVFLVDAEQLVPVPIPSAGLLMASALSVIPLMRLRKNRRR